MWNFDDSYDALICKAILHVLDSRRVSISGVQRQFRIGYNRAARIVEQMEYLGVVTIPGVNGNREVLGPPVDIRPYEEKSDEVKISPFEHERMLEAITSKKIVIWLMDTGKYSEDGTKILIVNSFSPFEYLANKQKRDKDLDNDINGDVLRGYRFTATMQVRTPLKILTQHGRIECKVAHKLPKITKEDWQGIWVPEAKKWKDIGIDMPEMPEGTMASQIGQIPRDGGDYLRFLIYVNNIKESKASREEKYQYIQLGRHMYGQDGMPFAEHIGQVTFW